MEDAFRVEIDDYLIDGKTYYANVSRPSIPSALSRLIVGVNSLDDLPASANAYGETVLYSFTGNEDGANPQAGLIMDNGGNLYGTTVNGGASGAGTVFKLDPKGLETVLYTFTGTNGDGANPDAGLFMDSAGNLYGTTVNGGASGAGTVFKLDTTGSKTVLYSLGGLAKADGDSPQGGLVMDNARNFYGTTFYGGLVGCQNDSGCGTVFKIDPTGQETVLHSFTLTNGDGENPAAGLVMDSGGNLYGTTSLGGLPGCEFGTASCGTVFEIDPTGHETVLYSFTGSYGDGAGPTSALIMDSAGNLYGTTDAGGGGGIGTVFELDTSGHETVLYSFDGTPGEAYFPDSSLIMDSAGNLYGTTYFGFGDSPGTVYKLDTTGHETMLYSFTGGSDGGGPYAGLIVDNAGNLYGTTANGGPAGYGVVFELSPPGFTVGGASVSISPGATSGNTSTITVTPTGGFTGNVTLTAAITSSPAGAQNLPTLSFGSSSPVSITGGSAGTATLTISTTAASSALAYPVSPGGNGYAAVASGTGLLSFAMLFGMGVPARRRRWQTRIGMLVFLVSLAATLVGCGSGGSSGGTNSSTTPGSYTVTVTGTSGSLTATGTVTLTVQ